MADYTPQFDLYFETYISATEQFVCRQPKNPQQATTFLNWVANPTSGEHPATENDRQDVSDPAFSISTSNTSPPILSA